MFLLLQLLLSWDSCRASIRTHGETLGLGACWDQMVMNWGCCLRRFEVSSRWLVGAICKRRLLKNKKTVESQMALHGATPVNRETGIMRMEAKYEMDCRSATYGYA